jgi:hypothetical protein
MSLVCWKILQPFMDAMALYSTIEKFCEGPTFERSLEGWIGDDAIGLPTSPPGKPFEN